MSTVHTGLVTFEEFENLPDPPGGYYELHHGQVVLMPFRKRSHVIAQETISDLVKPLARGRGFVAIEFPFRPLPDYESWQADVAVVTLDRWNQAGDYLPGAPELVIEVLSPSNTKAELRERQEICLSNGCLAFWAVDLNRRLVMATGLDRIAATYDCSMSIPLPEPIGGTLPVAAIFAGLR